MYVCMYVCMYVECGATEGGLPVSEDECWKALKDMKQGKSPGTDGFIKFSGPMWPAEPLIEA